MADADRLASLQLEDAEFRSAAPGEPKFKPMPQTAAFGVPKFKLMPQTPAPVDCMLLEFANSGGSTVISDTHTPQDLAPVPFKFDNPVPVPSADSSDLHTPPDLAHEQFEFEYSSSALVSSTDSSSTYTPPGEESKAMELELKFPELYSPDHQADHLPPWIKGCLEELMELQKQRNHLKSKFMAKRNGYEASYWRAIQPLCDERLRILKRDKGLHKVRGLPPFWLTAMKEALEQFSEEITDLDEKALEYLKDIKYTALHKPKGWRLEFFFDTPNPYFENEVLTKEAHFSFFRGAKGIKELKGTEIKWHHGKCLTQNAGKTLNKDYLVKAKSFFNLFMEREYCNENAGELLLHIRICDDIINGVIPHPLLFFLEYIIGHYEVPAWCGKNPYSCSDDDTPARLQTDAYYRNLVAAFDVRELSKIELKMKGYQVSKERKVRAANDDFVLGIQPLDKRRAEIVAEFLVAGVEPIANAHSTVVPAFWLNAMRGENTLGGVISDHDATVLQYLKDIKLSRLCEPNGWKYEFFFNPNPHFKNSVLTKEMHSTFFGGLCEDISGIGTPIEWHPDGFLTADEGGPVESFFDMFSESVTEEDFERDSQICRCVRRIIAYAASFYLEENNFKQSLQRSPKK